MKKGEDFLKTITDECQQKKCPVCCQNCDKTALVDLLWTWERCDCGKAPYTHLRPTIWHKACFNQQHNTGISATPEKSSLKR